MTDDDSPASARRTWQFGLAAVILWVFILCCLSLAVREGTRPAVVVVLLDVFAGCMTLIVSRSLRERRSWFDARRVVALVSGAYAVYHVMVSALLAK